MTNTGPSAIDGNLGLHPGTAVTGVSAQTVDGSTHAADAASLKAKADLVTAYDAAAAKTPTATAPADLGGSTLTPGVYNSASSIGLTGTLTLDAQGDPNAEFVFQAGSTLITASASRVELVNGAQPCNVFWQVGSSATFGTTTVFAGNVMALASITMNDGVSLTGRALARNGAVTLINDTITAAHCAAAPARELDVARALPAAAGIGANQGLRPNQAVEQALVAAGVDPTRATWTKASWTKASWTKAIVDEGDLDEGVLDQGVLDGRRHRRAVGGRDLHVRHVRERHRGRRRDPRHLDQVQLVESHGPVTRAPPCESRAASGPLAVVKRRPGASTFAR